MVREGGCLRFYTEAVFLRRGAIIAIGVCFGEQRGWAAGEKKKDY